MSRNKYIIPIIILVVIIILLLKDCSSTRERKPGELENQSCYFVPPSATLILSLNTPSILKEINFSQLKNTPDYIQKLKGFYNQNPPFALVFADPIASGIDTSKKITFYLDVGENKEEVYTASILNIADNSKFLNTIKKTKLKIEDEKYYQIAKIDGASSVAWNKEIAFFVTTDVNFKKSNLLKQVFNPNAVKYFDKTSEYLKFIESSNKDLSFWLDLSSYANNQLHASGKPGEFNKTILQGNTIYGNFNFGVGTIESDIHFKLNDIVSKVVKGIFNQEADRTVVNYLPEMKPSFITLLSSNIDGILNLLLQDSEKRVEARNSLVPYGLVIEDFGKALSGDVMLASYPNDTTTKSSVLFAYKIKDKEHLYRLLKVMEDVGKIQMIDTDFYRMNTGVVPFLPLLSTYKDGLQRLIIKDNYAFVSLDSMVVEGMKARQKSSSDSLRYLLPFNEKNNYLSTYGDRNFSALAKYSNEFSIKDYSLNYNGEQLNVHLNLVNPSTSSLKQLLKLK